MLDKYSPKAAERQAVLDPFQKRFDEAQERMKTLQKRMQELGQEGNPGLLIIAILLSLAALIFIYFWSPWSMYAALDPLEEASSTGQALGRGRELARHGGAANIWLVPLVFTIIMLVTTAACWLPGVFFGWPLAFAVVPGMYMCCGEKCALFRKQSCPVEVNI